MELKTQIKIGIKIRYQLQPLPKEGASSKTPSDLDTSLPTFLWSALCRETFPLWAQLSFTFFPVVVQDAQLLTKEEVSPGHTHASWACVCT